MKLRQRLFVAAVIGCFSNTVFAADSGSYYIGGGFGISSSSIISTSTSITTTHSSSGLHLLGGFDLNQNFAIEAEYFDLGEFDSYPIRVSAIGIGLSGVGIIPLNNKLSLYGKMGLASVNSAGTPALGSVLLIHESHQTDVSIGFGMQYKITPNATLRFSLDSYQCPALAGVKPGRVGMYGMSGMFHF